MTNTLDSIYIPREKWGDGGVGNHNNIKDVVASEGIVWVWYIWSNQIVLLMQLNLNTRLYNVLIIIVCTIK